MDITIHFKIWCLFELFKYKKNNINKYKEKFLYLLIFKIENKIKWITIYQ